MPDPTAHTPAGKELFYERFADEFDRKMNMYDTLRRVELVFDELLGGDTLEGKTLLDAGCGTGWFSQRACERGAVVTSLDVGEALLDKVRQKCSSTRVVGSVLDLPFADNQFDYVVSSEVIEHTPSPRQAVEQLVRVAKPGGLVAITTPNAPWHFPVWLASVLRVRPYQGVENWVWCGTLRRWCIDLSCTVEVQKGFHLAPLYFAPRLQPFLRYMDRFGTVLCPVMLCTAILCRKRVRT